MFTTQERSLGSRLWTEKRRQAKAPELKPLKTPRREGL
jgi:hypothetical protein